jgi:hypothetical protein
MEKATIAVAPQIDLEDGSVTPLHFVVQAPSIAMPVTLTYDQVTDALAEFIQQRIRRFGMIQKSKGHVSV